MSHFYGTLQGTRGEATRCGGRKTGLHTVAASWNGAIRVSLHHNEETGKDEFSVQQSGWYGRGISETIAKGVIGGPTAKQDINAGLLIVLKRINEAFETGTDAKSRYAHEVRAAIKKAER